MLGGGAMTSERLAIYDMDKTVTRRATFTPFLLHAARRLAPWRLLLLPAVAITGLGYALKPVDEPGSDRVHPVDLGEIENQALAGLDVEVAGEASDARERHASGEAQDPGLPRGDMAWFGELAHSAATLR